MVWWCVSLLWVAVQACKKKSKGEQRSVERLANGKVGAGKQSKGGTTDSQGASEDEWEEEQEEEYDDRPCHVCFSTDPLDLEQVMVLCDGCNGCYHLCCVGLDGIPEGSYLCEYCSFGEALP